MLLFTINLSRDFEDRQKFPVYAKRERCIRKDNLCAKFPMEERRFFNESEKV
jgi:hypothetical protein